MRPRKVGSRNVGTTEYECVPGTHGRMGRMSCWEECWEECRAYEFAVLEVGIGEIRITHSQAEVCSFGLGSTQRLATQISAHE